MLGFFHGRPVIHMSRVDREFHPKWLDREYTCGLIKSMRAVTEYLSLADFVEKERPASIVLYRTHALGDILMLLPVVRAFHRSVGLPYPITIVVERRFHAQLRHLERGQRVFRFAEKRGIRDYGADVHVNLNGCLEPDHWGGEESNHHRMDLYARALGLEIEREP